MSLGFEAASLGPLRERQRQRRTRAGPYARGSGRCMSLDESESKQLMLEELDDPLPGMPLERAVSEVAGLTAHAEPARRTVSAGGATDSMSLTNGTHALTDSPTLERAGRGSTGDGDCWLM